MTFDDAEAAAQAILAVHPGPFDAAIVLGSGLQSIAERLEDAVSVPYSDIPHFPRPTVEGHAGTLGLGQFGGQTVAIFQGRFHQYEGHNLEVVTFPVRVMARLGIPRLLLTAATGGIRDDLAPGTLVCVRDHINLLGANPLRGPNDDRFGTRFPDMTEVYSGRLRGVAETEASRLGIALHSGVYACVPGPSYETPAEVRMLRTLGADVVGMSTVPEAIVARHCGLEVVAFAMVSNWAAGLSPNPLSHQEVVETGQQMSHHLGDLLEAVCRWL